MGSKNRLPSLQKQAAIPKRERCPTQKLCPIQRPPHRKIPQAASHIRVGVVRRRCLTASPVVPGKRDKNEGLGIDGWVSHLCQLGACVSVWFAICPVPHSLPLPTHAYIPSPPPPPPPTARNIGRVLGGVNGEPVGGRRRIDPHAPAHVPYDQAQVAAVAHFIACGQSGGTNDRGDWGGTNDRGDGEALP